MRGAGKTYDDGTVALLPTDLRVAPGEFVTLLGPSGCGKTTLLRLVAGLLAPSSGSVRTSGAGLGYVFQEPTLMPWADALANVRLPLELAGVPRAEADARARAALAQVGLADKTGKLPRELSGGMKMRVSIARGLVTGASVLLLDEPFGALDEITRNRLDDELLALWQARALTVLFVTHSIHEAVFLSQRVLVMGASPGRVLHELHVGEPHPRSPGFRVSTRFSEQARALQEQLLAASAPLAAGAA